MQRQLLTADIITFHLWVDFKISYKAKQKQQLVEPLGSADVTDPKPTTTYSIYYYALYNISLIRELLLRLYGHILRSTRHVTARIRNLEFTPIKKQRSRLVFVYRLYILATPHAFGAFADHTHLYEGLHSIAARHIQPANYTRYGLKQQLGLIFDYHYNSTVMLKNLSISTWVRIVSYHTLFHTSLQYLGRHPVQSLASLYLLHVQGYQTFQGPWHVSGPDRPSFDDMKCHLRLSPCSQLEPLSQPLSCAGPDQKSTGPCKS